MMEPHIYTSMMNNCLVFHHEMLKYEVSSWIITYFFIMIQNPSWKAVLSWYMIIFIWGAHEKNYIRAMITFIAGHYEETDLNTLKSDDRNDPLLKQRPSSCRERVSPKLYQKLQSVFKSQAASTFVSACQLLDRQF